MLGLKKYLMPISTQSWLVSQVVLTNVLIEKNKEPFHTTRYSKVWTTIVTDSYSK